MPRTNISVSDEIADSLSQEAMRRNKTLYAFANEAMSSVLQVSREGGEPSEVSVSWRLGRMLKELDAVPLPGDLVEKIIKKLYAEDKEFLMETWEKEGERVGKYLQIGYQDMARLSEAAREFRGMLPIKRLEIRETEGSGSKPSLQLRAVGAGLSTESTECAEQFMRGVAAAYSWEVKESRISEGIIDMKMVRSDERRKAEDRR